MFLFHNALHFLLPPKNNYQPDLKIGGFFSLCLVLTVVPPLGILERQKNSPEEQTTSSGERWVKVPEAGAIPISCLL